jgi:hypothetical protein
MNNIKTIVIFDFDSTLVNTMGQEDGKKIWLEKKGVEYPHLGWWAREESLDTEVFSHPLNEPIYQEYIKYIHKKDTAVFLVTGRMQKIKAKVLAIVDMHKLSFDGIHCNNVGDTFHFKSKLFEKMISDNPKTKEFIMYDDRQEHIIKFTHWMKNFDVKITLHDVVNNTTFTNYLKK